MSTPWKILPRCALFFSLFLRLCVADVGTAAYYGPPYTPTVCFGGDTSRFPPNNLFAAAGEGVWDNGAACGRAYTVRCLSSPTPKACVNGSTVQVKVVDQGSMLNSMPSTNGTTLVLSNAAFQMIASSMASIINIEFAQV
ncbi:EG45-like domain containing protein [Musa acuminata AAA Group]|uniref:EG45-like domain containing protein n=1 Tax=Musa acuminata AAA Group TaxID=214697 RepID=UPI0031E213C5